MNFEIFVSEVRSRSAELGVGALRVTDTSPGTLRATHDVTVDVVMRQARLLGALSLTPVRGEDVVLFCSERQFIASAPVLLAVRAMGFPVVVKFVGHWLPGFLRALHAAGRWAMCAALNRMTAVLCQTGLMLEEVRALGIRNALQSPGYRRVDWGALRALPSAPVHPGELRLVHLGLVSEVKGVHDVLRALARLDRADISLDLFGQVPPGETGALAELLRRAPGARLKGVFLGNPEELLARYDALVLPSYHWGEGHPGAIIEAMAAGIPVLASRFRALPELVADGENGLLVEPRDVAGIARAIGFLADHPEACLRMGRAHRTRLAQHDARRAVEIILAALDASPAPPGR